MSAVDDFLIMDFSEFFFVFYFLFFDLFNILFKIENLLKKMFIF